MAKIINTSEFVENVENTKGVVVVDFFTTWCGPCKMLAPVENLPVFMPKQNILNKLNVYL